MGVLKHHVGQVTYPRMERQDLTQGQLGAFKFTPTDEVRPVFTRPSPLLTQPLPASPTRHHTSLQPPPYTSTDLLQQNWQAPKSPLRADPTFFNTYIKPDLTNSRIRLGPNAVRAAVDSASPTQKKQHWDTEAFRQAIQADIMHSNQHQLIGNEHHMTNFDLDPSVPAFTTPTNGRAMEDRNILYTSLIRALASEQQAHEETKQVLAKEKAARAEAEMDAQKWLEHNRSLIGSVNLLKSVLQHNMKKEQEQAQQAETVHRQASTKSLSSGESTILHDAVRNLHSPSKAPRDKRSTNQPGDDDAASFDLNIPDTPEFASLRKHFSDSTESFCQLQVEHTGSDQLIEITSPKSEHRNATEQAVNSSLQDSTKCNNENGSVLLENKSNAKMSAGAVAMPFDVPVKWSREHIFENAEDKISHLGSGYAVRSTNFYKHPVRYLPSQAEKNLYRTVMIDFIPRDTTYTEILKHIRGGALESVQLFDPVGSSTDFMTARIVFNYELGARSVYMHGQKPGVYIKGQRVRVWQVLEPTYPRDADLENEIFEEGFTRLLLIENATDAALAMLPTKLAYQFKAGFVIDVARSYDDLPMIEFTSVKECSRALTILVNDPDFGGSRFDFEEDPCSGAY